MQKTEREFQVANNMLIGACGYSIQTLLNESRNWTRPRNIVGKVVSFNLILQKAPFGELFLYNFLILNRHIKNMRTNEQ